MATIQDLGKVAYLNRGAYNNSTKYEVNDVVTYQGSSYVSNVNNNQGNLPTNATYWQVLVQKPVKGVDYFTTTDKKEMVDEITEDAESEFNQNVQAKTEAFNTNASDKTSAFNQNATSKTTDFDSNATSKTTTFNNNATSKTTDYNTNASSKISEYNTNHDNKVSAYDTNASDKTTTFDNHVSDKTDGFDSHVEDKTDEFDEHTQEIQNVVDSFDQRVRDLEDNQLYDDANGSKIYITDAHSTNVNEFGMSKESTQDGTPTPDNPVEVKTVTGYRNLLDEQYFENGSIDATTGANIENVQNGRGSNYIEVLPNKTYSIYVKNNVSQLRLNEYKSDKTNIQRLISTNANYLTITTTSNTRYLRWSLNYDGSTTVTQEIINNLNLQLTEGTEEHPYVPYGSNYVDVKVVGKNLFDKDNANILRGYFSTTGNIMSYSSDYRRMLYIPCKENTTYTITKVLSKMFRIASTATIPANNVAIINRSIVDTSTFRTFNTGEGANYLVVNYYNANEDTLTEQEILNSIQIEQGSIATTYESYKETIVPIPLNGNEIAGIGNYKDELIVDKSGHVWLNKKIAKHTLIGASNENWNKQDERYFICRRIDNISLYEKWISVAPNIYQFKSTIGVIPYSVLDNETGFGLALAYGIRINLENVDARDENVTIDDLRNYLNENPIDVLVALKESAYDLIDLNTTIDLRLFKGVNNITNSEDADMKIRYVQNSQIVINEIKNALLEIGGGE